MFKILVILWLLPFVSSAEVRQCKSIFEWRYGEVKSTFPHSDKYDVEVRPSRVKNQCRTSHCHMYSWTAELERVSGIDVSSPYLDAMRIYGQTLASLKNKKTTIAFGSFALESRNFIREYGIIPERAWTGRPDFSQNPYFSRLEDSLQSFLVQTLARMETTKNENKKKRMFAEAKIELFEMLENMIGPIPKSFEYEGHTYTPKSFAHKFFPNLYEPMINIEMARNFSGVEKKSQTIDSLLLKMNHEKAEALARQVIDNDGTVYLSYRHKDQFVDPKTGIMSIEAFSYPENAGVLTARQMTTHSQWGGSHAVRIVGYELDPTTGRVRKWKIQNSWGEKSGQEGYYHMYRDYFETFAWGLTFEHHPQLQIPKS